ncbi:MAG: hypothetical protein R2694_17935 [Ilumatobacteraceae bacterium]
MARADEFDVIELIDADDSAFAPAGGRERPEKDRQAGAGDQWLLLPTAWVVIGILLMGALAWVWQPWRERPEFTVGPVASVETTLTERLVLDRPIFEGRMADVRVTLDVPTDGYVLADPTAAPWDYRRLGRAAIVAVAAEDPATSTTRSRRTGPRSLPSRVPRPSTATAARAASRWSSARSGNSGTRCSRSASGWMPPSHSRPSSAGPPTA